VATTSWRAATIFSLKFVRGKERKLEAMEMEKMISRKHIDIDRNSPNLYHKNHMKVREETLIVEHFESA